MTWIYHHSVVRYCWCKKNRGIIACNQIDIPLDISKIQRRKILEIQHFQNDEDESWKSSIRIICHKCRNKKINQLKITS